MSLRSFVSLLTLIAFVPLATGCSSRQVVSLQDDPYENPAIADLREGRPVRIIGYTVRDEGYREWSGSVRVAPGDSLEFLPEWPAWNGDAGQTESFRVPRARIESLELAEPEGGDNTVAVVALVVATGAILLFVMMAHAFEEAFDGDNWFQGTN